MMPTVVCIIYSRISVFSMLNIFFLRTCILCTGSRLKYIHIRSPRILSGLLYCMCGCVLVLVFSCQATSSERRVYKIWGKQSLVISPVTLSP